MDNNLNKLIECFKEIGFTEVSDKTLRRVAENTLKQMESEELIEKTKNELYKDNDIISELVIEEIKTINSIRELAIKNFDPELVEEIKQAIQNESN